MNLNWSHVLALTVSVETILESYLVLPILQTFLSKVQLTVSSCPVKFRINKFQGIVPSDSRKNAVNVSISWPFALKSAQILHRFDPDKEYISILDFASESRLVFLDRLFRKLLICVALILPAFFSFELLLLGFSHWKCLFWDYFGFGDVFCPSTEFLTARYGRGYWIPWS